MPLMRPATADDLPALTDIYNHYVVNTTITFDLDPFAPEERRAWFDEHAATGRHRLIVAVDDGKVAGYASTAAGGPRRRTRPRWSPASTATRRRSAAALAG